MRSLCWRMRGRKRAEEGEVGERAAMVWETGEGVGEILPSRKTAGTERGAESIIGAVELFLKVWEGKESEGLASLLPLGVVQCRGEGV